MTAVVTDRRVRRGLETRAALRTAALRLFAERGFDETTVRQIADAAAVTSRTFFRHFAVKEDVLYDDEAEHVREFGGLLAARPSEEPLMASILAAVHGLVGVYEADRAAQLTRAQIAADSPAVAGRALRSVIAYEEVVADVVRRRLGHDRDALLPLVVANAVVGAFRAAHMRWLATGARRDLGALLDEAMAPFDDEFADRLTGGAG